jgi:hypothetical protein
MNIVDACALTNGVLAHIWYEDVRNLDGAICLLVVFDE